MGSRLAAPRRMSDEHAEPPAEAVEKPPRGAWLKANFVALALGLQAVVLVAALIALAVSGHRAVPVPVAEAAAADEPAAEPTGEPPAAEAKEEPKEEAKEDEPAPLPTHAPADEAKARARAEAVKAATSEAAEPAAEAPHAAAPAGLEAVVAELSDGNERFAQGLTRVRDPLELRRAPGQPRAVVVACSDATVPPEFVFDQGLGTLVVVRTAAELVDEGSLAAVEDAVARFSVPLVVVLGHEGCHAVEAAAGSAPSGPGLATVAARLRPVVGGLKKAGLHGKDLNSRAVAASTSFSAGQLLKRSAVLRGRHTPVLRAVYDESTGRVRWLDGEDETPPERFGRAPH